MIDTLKMNNLNFGIANQILDIITIANQIAKHFNFNRIAISNTGAY